MLADLNRGGFPAQIAVELVACSLDPIDPVDHMDGKPNSASLVGDRTRNRLPDPPGRIRAELESAMVIKFLDRPDQSEISFLDQIEKSETPGRLAFGDRDDQPKIGFDQSGFGPVGIGKNRIPVMFQSYRASVDSRLDLFIFRPFAGVQAESPDSRGQEFPFDISVAE